MEVSTQSMSTDLDKNYNRQVHIFRGCDGLRALEADWRRLERSLVDARFIHFYAWYKCHLENSEPNPDSVIFILVADSGTPVALFPLRRTSMRRFGIPLRTWEIFWPNDMGVCDLVFTKSAANRSMLQLLVSTLRGHKDLAWDILRLEDTLIDSCALYSLRAVPIPLSLTLLHHSSKYIRCDAGYESVMDRVSGHFRRNVRRQTKKVNELDGIEYRFVTKAEELDEAFDHFLRAEASSWKGGEGTGSAILLYEEKVNFYRALMREFSKLDACSINLILLNGRCIASQFCLAIGETLYLLKIGYSEEHRAIGPGNVLLNELLQRCCADKNIKIVSFITGASWNDSWAPESLDVYDSYLFNRTLLGIIVYCLETIKNLGRRLKHWVNRLRVSRQKTRHA